MLILILISVCFKYTSKHYISYAFLCCKTALNDFQQLKWPGSDFISSHCDVSTWCGSELPKGHCGSCPVIDLILTSNAPESSILRLDERSEIFHPPLQGQPNSQRYPDLHFRTVCASFFQLIVQYITIEYTTVWGSIVI